MKADGFPKSRELNTVRAVYPCAALIQRLMQSL
jgi:hypothetical protein